jgi:hypothetical protein
MNDDFCTKFILKLFASLGFVLILVGVCTNLLILLTCCQKAMRTFSTFIYFAFIAVSDIVYTISNLFTIYLVSAFEFDINLTFYCKVLNFTSFFPGQLSSWLLACAVIDRFIFISSKKYSEKFCHSKVAVSLSLFLTFLLAIGNLHIVILVEPKKQFELSKNESNSELYFTDQKVCVLLDKSSFVFYRDYFFWLDTFLYSIIPFLIIFSFNLILILKVCQVRRNINRIEQKIEQTNKQPRRSVKPSSIQMKNKKINEMIKTVMILTSFFIIASLPSELFYIIELDPNIPSHNTNCLVIVKLLLDLLMLFYHSSNFFILLKTNSKFRDEFIQLGKLTLTFFKIRILK